MSDRRIENDRRLPSCCGSEDGDVRLGIDPAPGGAGVEVWHCNSCGVMTVVRVIPPVKNGDQSNV